MEKVKTNVEKSVGDRIRAYDLAGVKVDEDYRRYYPYDEIASKVLGFTAPQTPTAAATGFTPTICKSRGSICCAGTSP